MDRPILKKKYTLTIKVMHLPGLKHGSVPELRSKFGTLWRDIVLLLRLYHHCYMAKHNNIV